VRARVGPGARAGRVALALPLLVLAIGALALALRVHAFASYPRGWDPCEYVWALEGGYLPHSPYIVYVGLGRLAQLVLPAASALSALSLIGGLALVVCTAFLVHAQSRSTLAAFATAAALAVFPGAVRMSGLQEVYALAAPLCVGACLAASRGRPGWSGIWFGAALAMHSAAVLVAPAWLLALVLARSEHGAARAEPRPDLRAAPQAWLRAFAGVALVPLVGVLWIALEMPAEARTRVGLLEYVRGIQPMPQATWLEHWWPSLEHAGWRAIERTVGWRPQLALCALLACCALRKPRAVALWVVYALPFFAYEALIGFEVDPGVHLMFTAPALASVLGIGAGEAARWASERGFGGRVAPTAILAALLALVLLPAALTAHEEGSAVEARERYLARTPQRELLWVREHAPPDAYVVQPPGTQNPNLAACYAQRRPIMLQHGRYWHFVGARGWPLMNSAYELLTVAWTQEQLARGATILGVCLSQDPLPPSPDGTQWEPYGPGVLALRRVE